MPVIFFCLFACFDFCFSFLIQPKSSRNDKGHKYIKSNVIDDNNEAWMAVQIAQGHVGRSIHFLEVLDKTLKIIWSPSSHPRPPDAQIVFASRGLIIATIYRHHLGNRQFSYMVSYPLKKKILSRQVLSSPFEHKKIEVQRTQNISPRSHILKELAPGYELVSI